MQLSKDNFNDLPDESMLKNTIQKRQANSMRAEKTQIKKQFQQMMREISKLLSLESKPVQIRIKEWMIKFQSVSEVEIWQKNRNLYCKTLLLMLKNKAINTPFHRHPPNSLPILSLYEIPFDIRQQLERQKNNDSILFKHHQEDSQKQNKNELENRVSLDESINQHRSKQKYALQDKIAHKKSLQSCNTHDDSSINKQICNSVRQSYNFLLKNYEKFMNKEEVSILMEQLWNYTANQ